MYVFIYVYVYIYLYIYIYIYMYIYIYTYVYTRIYILKRGMAQEWASHGTRTIESRHRYKRVVSHLQHWLPTGRPSVQSVAFSWILSWAPPPRSWASWFPPVPFVCICVNININTTHIYVYIHTYTYTYTYINVWIHIWCTYACIYIFELLDVRREPHLSTCSTRIHSHIHTYNM